MTLNLKNGNCLELMKELPDKSVDLFICDLPYGETNCKWDSKIDLEEFWKEFKRLRKTKRTACIHFCSTKFGYTLIKSWEKGFKMDMVWKKRNKTGGLQSRHRPMRNHEMVYFFYEQAPKYNRDKYHKRINNKKPASVVEEKIICKKEGFGWKGKEGTKICSGNQWTPTNPGSVVEEKYTKEYMENKQKCVGTGGSEFQGIFTEKNRKEWSKKNGPFEPPNPASVVEESEGQKKAKDWGYEKCTKSFDDNEKVNGGRRMGANFEPPNPVSVVEEKDEFGWDKSVVKEMGTKFNGANFEPPNPASVLEEKESKFHKDYEKNGKRGMNKDEMYSKKCIKEFQEKNGIGFNPPNPASVLEEKDIYGETKKERKERRKKGDSNFEPPNPASVVEEKPKTIPLKERNAMGEQSGIYEKNKMTFSNFEPPNPASVLEEEKDPWGCKNGGDKGAPFGLKYDPPNPASVVEEKPHKMGTGVAQPDEPINKKKDTRINEKGISAHGWNISHMDKPRVAHFDPKLPVSVVEEFIEPAEDEPKSMFESTKVFIGKRHHQTEKPQDILEFFLRYWTDEGDTVLDPTMGSGSTGVACKKLERNFIGYELDEKIFEVAQKRMELK